MNDLVITNSNLIDQICQALFDGPLTKNREGIKTVLYAHLRGMPTKPITRQAIKRWIDAEGAAVTRPAALAFLYDFLQQAPKQQGRETLLEQLLMFTARYANTGRTPKIQTRSRHGDDGILRMIDYLSNANALHVFNENISGIFGSSRDPADQSYYIIYRYSTTIDSILKTFLVCKKPQRGFISTKSFVHFIRGGDNYQPDVTRESQGVILKMDKCYYWLGYQYRVPAEEDSAGEYQAMRVEAKKIPIALEMIVAESDDIAINPGLFPGLIVTTAAMNQPVISRIAILHLGMNSGLKRLLRYNNVLPTEIPISGLEADLKDVVVKLRELGCKRLGKKLERLGNIKSESKIFESLAAQIREMLDNSSAADSTTLRNRGALETFSANKSLRPRP